MGTQVVPASGSDVYAVITEASLLFFNASCIDVWWKGSKGLPPSNDPCLARILKIYDLNCAIVGTGYLD